MKYDVTVFLPEITMSYCGVDVAEVLHTGDVCIRGHDSNKKFYEVWFSHGHWKEVMIEECSDE